MHTMLKCNRPICAHLFHADVRSYRLTQRCRASFHFRQKKTCPADAIGNRRGFVCQSALSKQLKLREEILQHEPVIDAPVYTDRAMLSHVNTVHLFVRMRSRAHVKLAAVRIQHNASESPVFIKTSSLYHILLRMAFMQSASVLPDSDRAKQSSTSANRSESTGLIWRPTVHRSLGF